jgi:hypothetical protein
MAGPWNASVVNEQDDLVKLDIKELLTLVLLELRRMNQHLYSITDEEGE